jgi:integrase/recombinase XerD
VNPLRRHLADYLTLRRAMGFDLDRAEKLIGQFLSYLEAHDGDTVTIEHALAWARLPATADPWWWALRLSAIRPFAAHLRSLDGVTEVPPAGMIPGSSHRATPYLYSPDQIQDLIRAAANRVLRVNAATYPALIGLLAVTGMRIGEAIALDTGDFNAAEGVLTVRRGKFGKSRLLPLHPTATAAIDGYLATRSRLHPAPSSPALFISSAGTRMSYNRTHATFRQIAAQAGVTARSAACRPRIHDLRHSFAVQTLLDGYRCGADVQALLPRLSTYLGHTDPKHTYWYLSAAPELLALAAGRLETYLGERA